jgi:hypothetical protein
MHPGRSLGAGFAAMAIAVPLAAIAQTIELRLPIDCEVGRTCAIQHYVDHDSSQRAQDYRCGSLTYDGHDGTDFRLITTAMQRSGVNVFAAADGQVQRVRDGMVDRPLISGGPVVDARACGNGLVIAHSDGWETQYCHLAQGSLLVRPGEPVRAGQAVGRVGFSGNTEFPHLHFTVRLRGAVVDPFSFGAPKEACGGAEMLWSPPLRPSLVYRERTVLNAGFAIGPFTMKQIENGEAGERKVGPKAPALVAFVRTIGLKERDVQRLLVRTPSGQVLVEHEEKALDRNKAQFMIFSGRKMPPNGWPPGTYLATYTISYDGKVVFEHDFGISVQ